ncbi:glycoside hydrolase [Rozella allomycis CSF55]|uniref:alpha-1,2-Mannosidase n=1 Tax=Rozella allomycis (strain CSF55) TaxID=988480 RepID=A0A075AYP2_ROZAC|nr:Glycoside hydrolase, family 47 domain-containing protein [Rozella allomycis CSF55]RKP19996.1 glycoside hydrolase [Rozella allomycis CSF55]|eukprot:EPZ35239.1 Glycoside hydrolase, family 47 domain-containing protein [Rozella allomycis CSF55]
MNGNEEINFSAKRRNNTIKPSSSKSTFPKTFTAFQPQVVRKDSKFKTDEKALDFIKSVILKLKVEEMIKHAWSGYSSFALGSDELRPISKTSRNWMTKSGFAATLIDSLDTLWIADMKTEFYDALEEVKKINFDQNDSTSVFETCIRILGGLLSAYDLSGEKVLIEKAIEIADRLLPAFDSPSGIPSGLINLHTYKSINYLISGETGKQPWLGDAVSLAEIGSLQLEFTFLSEITGIQKYKEKSQQVFFTLSKMKTKVPGLYPMRILPDTFEQPADEFSLGGLSDSFYEYLLKLWILEDKKPTLFRKMFDDAMDASTKVLLGTNKMGYRYFGTYRGILIPEMEHLTCFSGGMIALGVMTRTSSSQQKYFELASEITETCYQMYHRQVSGLSPEKVSMNNFEALVPYFIQRPETVESIFYMWRFTHNPKYREWGLEIAKNIEMHCKVKHGYAGVENVTAKHLQLRDNQESFFLAETLKYLYLLFSDDDKISLDQYVFNTEGHPFSIHSPRRFFNDFSKDN